MAILIKKDEIPETLEDIFADDDLGLLANVKPKDSSTKTDLSKLNCTDRLLEFVKINNRLPDETNPNEFDISLDLENVRRNHQDIYNECLKLIGREAEVNLNKDQDNQSINQEVQEDINVNTQKEKVFNSLDDIFADDTLGILNYESSEQSLSSFHKKKTSSVIQSSSDGKIEQAEPCKDFYKYEKFFSDLVSLLRSNDLIYVPIVGQTWRIQIGDIFILKKIHRIVVDTDDKYFVTKQHTAPQRRVTIVYENQLIQKPFDSSLSRDFFRNENSMRVVAKTEKGAEYLENLKDALIKLKTNDASNVLTGYVYILKSLSSNTQIREFVETSHLVKIGYCTTSVEERIKNCKNEATYLEGDVEVVAKYKCFNFDPHKLERIIHAFLAEHRLNVELTDFQGKKYKPKEWFTVSVKTACDVVERIFDGTIHEYRLDPIQGKMIKISS